MIRALGYLWVRSACNRVRLRFRRLRQPKYLAGGLVGLLYLWLAFFRNLGGGRWASEGMGAGGPLGAEVAVGLEIAGAWFLLGVVAWLWVVPSRRAALEFGEAEMQFLFSAPISRRGLIHYKLAQWQGGLVFTSLLMAFFSGRLWSRDGAWVAIVSWWLLLLLIQLHALGASFVRTRLWDRGLPHWKRRCFVALILGGALVGCGLWGWREAPPWPSESGDFGAVVEWGLAWSQVTPLAELLLPLRWMVRPLFAREADLFLGVVGPVLGLILLHYLWVLRSAVAFEEASLEAVRSASEATGAAGARSRRVAAGAVRTPILVGLRPQGMPWLAIAWKNLGASGGIYRSRGAVVLWVGLGMAVVLGGRWIWEETFSNVLASLAAVVWLVSVVGGPTQAKVGVRSVLAGTRWERLRALPLRGWQIVLGEMLMPWLELLVIQSALVCCGVAFFRAGEEAVGVGFWERGVIWMGLSVLGPSLTGLGFCVQAAAALLFPAWMASGTEPSRGGFEVLGQQVIVLVGQLLVMLVAVTPAALVGVLVGFTTAYLGGGWLGFWAGASSASLVMLVEAGGCVWVLGEVWDRLDPSRERAV